jgi:DNA-binding GntR family transcriptional regulator
MSATALARIQRPRATDEVYQALRQSILSSVFKPGQRLQVEEISVQLGVSLTPVRHAIQQLEAEGLIEVRPRSGTFVAQLTARDVMETSDIRCALECLAAEAAIERIGADELAGFRRLLDRLSRTPRSERDRKQHEEDNRQFHRMLIEYSGNRRLAEMYESLNAHLQIARIHSRKADWATRLPDEQREHEEIVAAIAARNLPRLKEALRVHILRARRSLAAGLE